MKPRILSEVPILALLREKAVITIQDAARVLRISPQDGAKLRALQRLLQDLVKKQILDAEGATRARVYRLRPQHGEVLPAPSSESLIPFSPKAQTVRAYISRAIGSRKHVSYEASFLENYRPNKSSFLSVVQRARLLELGRSDLKKRPAGTYASSIYQRLLIDLAWNSSRLEGNTYSLLQTKRLLEEGTAAEGKEAEETQMLLNHKEAIHYIVNNAGKTGITRIAICEIHALLSDNLLGDPEACGRVRIGPVAIGESNYHPLENRLLLVKYLDLFVAKARKIKDPFEQSFFSLVHLSYLQAFDDVNKRTSRLVSNVPLVKANLKPLSFAEVPVDDYLKAMLGVYEMNDASMLVDVYLWAYERSAQKFSAIQQSMGESNLLKLTYRDQIRDIVHRIVTKKIMTDQVEAEISRQLEDLFVASPQAEKLSQVIEAELAGLHEGNAILYRIRPRELKDWKGRKK